MRISNVVQTTILISLLAACSSKDAMLPIPDKSMHQVYSEHMQGGADGQLYDARTLVKRPMHNNDVDLSQYVRTESTQLHSRFKRIPNPTLYMFVAPHLAAQSNVPVPGYLTEFKMWSTDHYALPGELSDMSPEYRSRYEAEIERRKNETEGVSQ